MSKEQVDILRKITLGHVLKCNCTIDEDTAVQHKTFAWLYVPVEYEHVAHSSDVTLEDLQCLQDAGMVRPEQFEKGGLATQDGRVWRNWTINYQITREGIAVLNDEHHRTTATTIESET
jgi:hypothetical protein